MTSPYINVDLFCGGGGAGCGFRMATGRDPDVAVNHDPKAIAMHQANHPGTLHICQDMWTCPPRWATKGRPVAWLHASPDCTHHSKAKGGPPKRDEKRRDLPWTVVKWIRELLPICVSMENVEEITSWGPCDRHGVPIPSQAGVSFKSFVATIRRLGYAVQWQELRACDYGAPTIRKRLFLLARRDGKPIVWPAPTHGDPASEEVRSGHLKPWRTAAECIDWRHPCPSIFERKRPLAEATLHRIAEGIERYVVRTAKPFIVTYYGPKKIDDFRGCGMDGLLGTQTTENRHALVSPYFVGAGGPAYGGKPTQADKPFGTLMTENHQALVSPVIVGIDQQGARSAVWNPDAPLSTVVTKAKHAAACAFLAKHYGGVVGHELERPIGSITAGGNHVGEVRACAIKYYGQGVGQDIQAPAATVTTRDRMALVETRPMGGHAAEVRELLRWPAQQGRQVLALPLRRL